MPTVHTLPDNPSLDHLRWQARTLQRAARAGDHAAVARIRVQNPGVNPAALAAVSLSAAQFTVAREYGFASWPKLRRYLTLAEEYGWDAARARRPMPQPADEFCALACLHYTGDDGPHRWSRAGQLLAAQPDLTHDHIWAAATAADPATVGRLLAADPALARRRGGPHRATPLFYLAYSRLLPTIPAAPVLKVAQLLLAAGADPAEGYLLNRRPYPFTLLTGVFGGGEEGSRRCPPHPHWRPLARLLLENGADPHDSQALYNRQFEADDDHLRLLFRYGLGAADQYPWREKLGELLDSPAELLRVQLRWAVWHNLPDRVQLLVSHGVDARSPLRHNPAGPAWLPDDGHTAIELAALCGNTSIVELLRAQGLPPPRLDPAEQLIAAAFRADRREVARLRAAHPALAEQLRQARPGLMAWAAANGRAETVALLADLGFDVNAPGRGDVPVEGPGATPLHHAVASGEVAVVRLLLQLGADPNGRDPDHHATPLEWARYLDRPEVVALLSR